MSDTSKHELADTAARSGDLEAFKEAIIDRTPLEVVTYRYPHGETYLHWAATAENGEALVEYLVDDLGAMVNINNWYGATPLYYACSKGRAVTIDALLARGADTRAISTFSGYNCVDMAHSQDENLLDSTLLRTRHNWILDSLQQSAYFDYLYRQILSWRMAYWQRCAPNKSTVQTVPPKESLDMSDMDIFHRCVEDEIEFASLLENGPDYEACLGCGKEEDLKRCARCKRAKLCSDECAKKTWHIHKVMCEADLPERKPFHTRSYLSMNEFSL